jgi:hypothetical protein
VVSSIVLYCPVGEATGGVSPVSPVTISQVRGHLALGLETNTALIYGGGLTALVMGLVFVVVIPAAYAKDPAQREAAYKVLDRILRFFRPRR